MEITANRSLSEVYKEKNSLRGRTHELRTTINNAEKAYKRFNSQGKPNLAERQRERFVTALAELDQYNSRERELVAEQMMLLGMRNERAREFLKSLVVRLEKDDLALQAILAAGAYIEQDFDSGIMLVLPQRWNYRTIVRINLPRGVTEFEDTGSAARINMSTSTDYSREEAILLSKMLLVAETIASTMDKEYVPM